MIEGIDISHHQGRVDWAKVKKAGGEFAFLKATEGVSYTDNMFATNRTNAKNAGLLISPYHFYHHDQAPEAQAAHFISVVGSLPAGELQPAVDVELASDGAGNNANGARETLRRLGVFFDLIKRGLGRDPIIYTYPYAWQSVTNNSQQYAKIYPLWIASYGKPTPSLIGGWTLWTFWQYTDRGRIDGVAGPVDRDRFNGSMAGLRKFAGL